ncbi:MAG TPA: biosynthetic peptidoglycan transglycosylase [Roseiarcus sp.]|jgi:membrane peptidoglycan carboxypeptidase
MTALSSQIAWDISIASRRVLAAQRTRRPTRSSNGSIYTPLRTIAPTALAAVIASEDASFCDNDGVDWGALREVLSGAGEHGPSRGVSTITMQTAKNLFLWPGRSTIRKGLEIGMALVLGEVWSKARTLEIYLNIARMGRRTRRDRSRGPALFPQERKSTQSA